MVYVVPILIAVLTGISWVVYNHPEHGRKLISYFFPIISALALIVFIFSFGWDMGILEGYSKRSNEVEYNLIKSNATDMLYLSGAVMLGSMLLLGFFNWLSHLFEDAKKSTTKKPNKKTD